MKHRRGRALKRRYGRTSGRTGKTFGRVPVGALFQLKDDPDNAILKKVSKGSYVVVTRGLPGSGLKFPIAASYPIKRGRQS
jgi:hypothetical protein